MPLVSDLWGAPYIIKMVPPPVHLSVITRGFQPKTQKKRGTILFLPCTRQPSFLRLSVTNMADGEEIEEG